MARQRFERNCRETLPDSSSAVRHNSIRDSLSRLSRNRSRNHGRRYIRVEDARELGHSRQRRVPVKVD